MRQEFPPYGIVVMASHELSPDAPVQRSVVHDKDEMAAEIMRARDAGYDLAKDQVWGYLQNKKDALEIIGRILEKTGDRVHLYGLTRGNALWCIEHG